MKSMLPTLIIIICSLLNPVTTHAVLVFDPSVFARLGDELLQIQKEITILKQQLDALKQLAPSQYQWSNAQHVINKLGNLMRESNGLAYNVKNIHEQFKDLFPGYQAPQDFSKQYQQHVSITLNTLEGVMRSLGLSAEDFQNENIRLTFLQRQAQSAVGQTQAIQASAQIASEQVSQLQLLRQILLAQTQAQTTYYAHQVQADAFARAELAKVIEAGSTQVPIYGSSGHSIQIHDD